MNDNYKLEFSPEGLETLGKKGEEWAEQHRRNFESTKRALADSACSHQWISVSDRMPEPNVDVLFYEEGGGIKIGSFYSDKDGWKAWFISELVMQGFGSEAIADVEDVKCWMPLPEPPKN